LIKILNRPFPIIESAKEKIAISVIFGFFIFLFLLVFQPFGLDRYSHNKLLYFSGYGIITSFVILFNSFVLTNIFKNFFLPENWTIGKNFIHSFLIIVPIAVLNWLYSLQFEMPDYLDYSFGQFLFMTVTIGIFPSIFLEFYAESRLRKKNEKLSEIVNKQFEAKHSEISTKDEIIINLPNSSISVISNQILCVKAMGNYSTIYFIENNLPKKEIIRATMKNIESELSKDKNIVRCHKSFFVNIDKITTTSGNARALYLYLNELDFSIPVSRGFSNNMLLLLN